MFLSYVVVPVFALTILLNFFCLYSPIDSQQISGSFTKCDDCLKSKCHKESQGTCALAPDNTTFICFSCVSPWPDYTLFPDKDTCEKSCTDPMVSCVCDGLCYSCIVPELVLELPCIIPTYKVDDSCTAIPYGPPDDSEAPPEDVPA